MKALTILFALLTLASCQSASADENPLDTASLRCEVDMVVIEKDMTARFGRTEGGNLTLELDADEVLEVEPYDSTSRIQLNYEGENFYRVSHEDGRTVLRLDGASESIPLKVAGRSGANTLLIQENATVLFAIDDAESKAIITYNGHSFAVYPGTR